MGAYEITLPKTIEQTENKVREVLSNNGFGVLTEINVSKILKEKIQVDRTPLKILGACNPVFANQALEIDPSVALLLPCNVVLESLAENSTRVSIVNPREMMDNPLLEALATQASEILEKVVGELDLN